MSLNKLWEMVKDREALHATVHGVTERQTRFSNWTTAIYDAVQMSEQFWVDWLCQALILMSSKEKKKKEKKIHWKTEMKETLSSERLTLYKRYSRQTIVGIFLN